MQRSERSLAAAIAVALAAATPVAAQAPNLAPSTLLPDAAATVGLASGGQRQAAMAAGAASSLLVFEDDRAGDADILALRVDANGDPLDPVPFVVDASGGQQRAPQVAWNGTAWLVVYSSEVDPGSGYFAPQVTARRVSSQGTLLDAAPLPIAVDSTGANYSVASDGVDWVVGYAGFSAGSSDLRARRVTAGGSVLDPGGALVQASAGSILFGVHVAYAGGSYLFSWSGSGTVCRRTTPALALLGAAPTTLPVGSTRALGNGAQFLFAWSQQTPQFTHEVVVQRYTPTLTPVDAAPVPVSAPATTTLPSAVAAAWDGTSWLIGWSQTAAATRLARFSAAGSVLDPGGVPLPGPTPSVQYGPSLGALSGGGAVWLWHDARHGSADDVYGVPFTGVAAAERGYSLGGEALRSGRCSAAGDGYLITAVAERADGSRLLVWRLDALGRGLDPQPLVAATGTATQLTPGGSAWNGSYHLVVWADATAAQVVARRLNANGVWLDAAPFAVMPGFHPDVAANGADFLVTGLHYPSYPQFVYSYAARVRGSDGAVLDAPARLVGSSFARRVRVAPLGTDWLVATQSHWSHNQNQGGISLDLVAPTGAVTPIGSMAVLNMQGGGTVELASAGSSALIAAQTGSNWTNTEVVVQRVLPNGTLPSPMAAITMASPNGQARPTVVWNGHEYVVTYETYQNNVWSYDFESDVYGIRLAEDGTQLDASGQPFWHGPAYDQRSDGDGLGQGRALHLASVWDPGLAAMRLAHRVERAAGLQPFGTGTPGCVGGHGIDATSAPVAGNAAFVVRCDRGPAAGVGVLALGTGAYAPGFDPGLGFLLHLDLAPPNEIVVLPMFTDPSGVADVLLPLTPVPAWTGFTMVAQGAFWWPGPCLPSPSGFSSTPGLSIAVP